MQNSQLPAKWYKPFAVDDANKVEIPVTTLDATRASQSLGFPPLTMQPPESGGVPPQGEDFNGAMNQVARIVWWMMAGGALPFDNSFATNPNINGYPLGARIASADLAGEWLSTANDNVSVPDTTGLNWIPGYHYGVTAITGLTNANVTLSATQGAKSRITFAGTLTGNVQIIFPGWLKDWVLVNNTTGAFTLTAKTVAGAGVIVPQNGAPTLVTGDGSNILQVAPNIAVGNSRTQAAQINQLHSAYATRGLRAANNTATPTTKFDASADVVVLRNPTDGSLATRTSTGTVTNDITVAGPAANGRDQAGAFPASNYVHFYFIWNGTTLATVSSLTAPPTGPTLPSGYTHWAYIGCVILTAGSAITPVTQRGSWVRYNARQASLVGGSATTETAVAIATLIPSNALNFELSVVDLAASTNGSGALDITLNLGVVTGSNMIGRHFGVSGVAAGTSQFTSPGSVVLPNVNQNYYYSVTVTTGTGPATTHNVTGYEVPNGAM